MSISDERAAGRLRCDGTKGPPRPCLGCSGQGIRGDYNSAGDFVLSDCSNCHGTGSPDVPPAMEDPACLMPDGYAEEFRKIEATVVRYMKLHAEADADFRVAKRRIQSLEKQRDWLWESLRQLETAAREAMRVIEAVIEADPSPGLTAMLIRDHLKQALSEIPQ